MIDGERVTLRAARPEDDDLLQKLRNDVNVQRALVARVRPNTEGRVREWVERMSAEPTSAFFVIARNDSGPGVGFLQLTGLDFVDGLAHLGICVAPAHQEQGYGREALELAATYARTVFGTRKLVLKALASNRAAIRLYETSGFVSVGVHRRHFFTGGEYEDVVIMERFLSP